MNFFLSFSVWGVKADVCPHCKNSLDPTATAKLIRGRAVRLHSGCAEEIINGMRESEELTSSAESGAGKGIAGAILFGLAASIPWAIVYALGWFVGWLGALIGFGVVKGYEKFGGKIKKPIIPVFALIIIVCVVFAQFLGDAIQLGYYINNGEASRLFVGYSRIYKNTAYRRTGISDNSCKKYNNRTAVRRSWSIRYFPIAYKSGQISQQKHRRS